MKPAVVLGLVGVAVAALFFVLFSSPDEGGVDPGAPDGRVVTSQERGPEPTTNITLDTTATSGRIEEAVVSTERETVASTSGNLLSGAWSNGLEGIVLDPDGEPLADVELELAVGDTTGQFGLLQAVAAQNSVTGGGPAPTWRTQSGDEGTFRFANLPPNQTYTLTAIHPDFAETKKSNFAIHEEGTTQIKVRLSRGYQLEGVVLDDLSGKPIAGAELRLQTIMSLLPGRDGLGDLTATTDEDGFYSIANVTQGTRNLTVNADGYGSRTRNNLLFSGPLAGSKPVNQDFRLAPGLELAGRVFAPDMSPIPGAQIEATSYETAQVSRGKAVTDATGLFVIEDLAEGTFMVIVRAPGYSDQRVTRVQLSDPELQIIMARQGGVMGQVVSGQNGAAVPKFRASVRMVAPGSTTYGRAVSSELFASPNGEFALSGLESGSYAMYVEADGFAPTFSETFIVNQGITTSDVVVRMGQGGTITGRLVDATSGQPVAGAVVKTADNGYVENPFTQMIGGMMPRTTTDRTVRTDSEGNFAIEGVTATIYQVRITHAEYTSTDVKDIVIGEGQTNDLGTIQLFSGAEVSGTVFDASGRALPNATVTLSGSGYPRTVRTNDAGRFVIDNVHAGSWKLAAQRPITQGGNPFEAIIDIQASERTLTVIDGQEVTLDLTLDS